MRVLVLGSGAREHAIAWAFSKSKRIDGLFLAPGNAGTKNIGENIALDDICDAESVLQICRDKNINLVFVGPEAPLVAGLVDTLTAQGIPCFGPKKAASQLEGSKIFSKDFMLRNNIPTASAHSFQNLEEAKAYILSESGKQVIKKCGLAAGKGVFESSDHNELIQFAAKVLEDDEILVEEYLEGFEISIFVLTDGENYISLPPCADFKKAGEDDTGLNTGGMGAICPVPLRQKDLLKQIDQEIIQPTIEGLNKESLNYKGLLYIGCMVTETGVKVLEYNVRFGDPETQALIPLIRSDFGELMSAVTQGTLNKFPLEIRSYASIAVVIAAEGYPGIYEKNIPVETFNTTDSQCSQIFHTGTIEKNNQVLTNAGRCFTVVALGEDLMKARYNVYKELPNVHFRGGWYRKDIGKKFIFSD